MHKYKQTALHESSSSRMGRLQRERFGEKEQQHNLHIREATQPLRTWNAKETAKDCKYLSRMHFPSSFLKRAKNGTILVKKKELALGIIQSSRHYTAGCPLSSLSIRGRETITYKLPERLWRHSLTPSLSYPSQSWRKQHLYRALGCTSHLGLTPTHLLEKQRLSFASSSPWDSLSQRNIIVNRKTHLVSCYFQYLETVCDSSGTLWSLGKQSIHPLIFLQFSPGRVANHTVCISCISSLDAH